MKTLGLLLAFLIPLTSFSIDIGGIDTVYVTPHTGGRAKFTQIDLSKSAAVKNQLAPANGGTGQDFSASTGALKVSSGTVSAGTLGISNGGTGQTTANPAFNALAPTTTKGDLIVYSGGVNARQAIGTDGQVLISDSTQTPGLKWGSPQPSGAALVSFSPVCPSGTQAANGTAVSRTTFATLLAAITLTQSGTASSGSQIVTGLSDTSSFYVGEKIESTKFTAGTTVSSIDSSSQVHLSNTAGSNGSTSIQFFPHGNGDGSTTFNVPNTNGVFLRGVGSQTISAISYSGLKVGQPQGDEIQGHRHSISDPGHTHTVNVYNGGGGATGQPINGATSFQGQENTGSSTTGISVTDPSSDGTNGTPRTGLETRPASLAVQYCVWN